MRLTIGDTKFEAHMRKEHPDLENTLDHVTITPFQIRFMISCYIIKKKLRAHEGLWITNFNPINKGLNRRQENELKDLQRPVIKQNSKTLFQKTAKTVKINDYRNKLRSSGFSKFYFYPRKD